MLQSFKIYFLLNLRHNYAVFIVLKSNKKDK